MEKVELNRHFISDIFFYQEGPGVRKWQFTESGVKLINVGNINNGKIDLSSTKINISEEEAYGKYSHFLIDEGDLLIACSGIVVENFHNKIAFINKEHLPLCLNTSTMRFKELPEKKGDLNFLKYFLQTNDFKSQLRKLITGSAQLNFGPSHIRKIEIPLPPLSTQQKIATILDQANAIVTNNRAIVAKYDALTQSLFLDMFGDPVKNEKGWEKMEVINYCSCIVPGRDKPKSFTGNIPWVTTDDLVHLGITSKSKKDIGLSEVEISNVKAKKIPAGSVIMTCVGNLGVISINEIEIIINQQLHAFQCFEQLNNLFLMHCLSFQKGFMYKMASSTTVPYMNKTICNSIPIISPPITLQTQFAERVSVIETQKQQAQLELAKSEALFQSLLQGAFKGELV
ncbi:restriction endonuclease subunit S [Flavobacterium sp.]|jgi:type I restriction enzyme S subunit|uniref:restriction endonuclease subunit S n=1 Tax=Flavobacterium sp. TaxID=239 RepID=UPI0037C0709A